MAALGLPTLLVQEGGYNLACIGAAVLNLLRAFEKENQGKELRRGRGESPRQGD